jgi:hypothetical protein
MSIARQLDAATGVLRTTISGTVSMDVAPAESWLLQFLVH